MICGKPLLTDNLEQYENLWCDDELDETTNSLAKSADLSETIAYEWIDNKYEFYSEDIHTCGSRKLAQIKQKLINLDCMHGLNNPNSAA